MSTTSRKVTTVCTVVGLVATLAGGGYAFFRENAWAGDLERLAETTQKLLDQRYCNALRREIAELEAIEQEGELTTRERVALSSARLSWEEVCSGRGSRDG